MIIDFGNDSSLTGLMEQSVAMEKVITSCYGVFEEEAKGERRALEAGTERGSRVWSYSDES